MTGAVYKNSTELLFAAIKELFYSYFDHPWLINIIEEYYTDSSRIGIIRTFLSLPSDTDITEYHLILTGLRALREFIRVIQSTVLPAAGFHLKIYSPGSINNRETLLLKKCIIYTLPANVRKLDSLTVELENALMRESLIK